jgi:hypothetical protein
VITSKTANGYRGRRFLVIATTAFSVFAHAQSAKQISSSGGAKEKLIGAWHRVHIDAPGPDGKFKPVPQPKGLLIYTREGHMSVQLTYLVSAHTPARTLIWSCRPRGEVGKGPADAHDV